MACTDFSVSPSFPRMSEIFPSMPTHIIPRPAHGSPSKRTHSRPPLNSPAFLLPDTALPAVGAPGSFNPALIRLGAHRGCPSLPASRSASTLLPNSRSTVCSSCRPLTLALRAPLYVCAVVADAAGLRRGAARRGAGHAHAPRAAPLRRRASLQRMTSHPPPCRAAPRCPRPWPRGRAHSWPSAAPRDATHREHAVRRAAPGDPVWRAWQRTEEARTCTRTRPWTCARACGRWAWQIGHGA
ncbi:hypothetical protein EDB92DRAFT_116806 [Lactarius akahatsu]|uniref:Uncharacterized protein n=1 Tax=Lactarius akahatsu TaxID=416441 RepID=A0AAD4QD30_9AGAM|nr:hypothetical protein EDB92DRAFT_116806 [Lactarius akahatsu]